MTVTYIHHSAFLVETESACLLFDYFEGELPEILKPLYVLASHSHGDHFSEKIFSLADGRENTVFLLSYDIPERAVPRKNLENTHFLKPNEVWDDGRLQVETFRSTDEGVAFWCTLDGKEIYHAGDLNHWYWEGEEEDWNRDMTVAYRQEMARMAGRTADIAFLPVDPRLEQWFYLGADDFMKAADARHLVPMHFWGDPSVCEKLKEHPCSRDWRDRILTIEKKGQRFIIE